MSEENDVALQDKYLVLKLSKQIDLGKLLKMLRAYQKEHEEKPLWRDLAEILSSVELDQIQTKIGEFIEE